MIDELTKEKRSPPGVFRFPLLVGCNLPLRAWKKRSGSGQQGRADLEDGVLTTGKPL